MKRTVLAQRKNKDIYEENGLVYKVYEAGTNKGDILAEAYAHSRAEETGLRMPKFMGVTIFDDRMAIITEYVEGPTLEQLMDENPEMMDEYLNLFVNLQLEAQSKDCPLLKKHNDKMNYKICNTELSATLRYDLHSRVEAMSKANKLCHGDFNPSNIVVNKGLPYIIDWSHATIGAPEADAARSYMLFVLNGKKEVAKKYLELYCSMAKVEPETVKAWLPILAATQSLKKRPEEQDILNQFIYETYEG